MDTTDTLNLMLEAVSIWAFEELESKIDDHKRTIGRLQSQKRMLSKIVGQYKAAQVKAEKRIKQWEKKSREAVKKARKVKFPTAPVMGPVTVVAARKLPA